MKISNSPFYLLLLAIFFNIATSCSDDSTETAVSTKDQPKTEQSIFQRGNLSQREAVELVARNMVTMERFLDSNDELYNVYSKDFSGVNPDNWAQYLSDKGFRDVNTLVEANTTWEEGISNLNYYIEKDKNELGISEAKETPTFHMLIDEVMHIYQTNMAAGNGCLDQWQNDMQDCRDDALLGSTVAVIAAAGGIWPGLLVAGEVMIQFTMCKRRAQRDYNYCMSH